MKAVNGGRRWGCTRFEEYQYTLALYCTIALWSIFVWALPKSCSQDHLMQLSHMKVIGQIKMPKELFPSGWWLFSSTIFCLCSLFAVKPVRSWQCPVLLTEPFGQHTLCPALLPERGTPQCSSPSSENSPELSQPLHVFLGTAALLDESALAGWHHSWNQSRALQREIQRSSCCFMGNVETK